MFDLLSVFFKESHFDRSCHFFLLFIPFLCTVLLSGRGGGRGGGSVGGQTETSGGTLRGISLLSLSLDLGAIDGKLGALCLKTQKGVFD